VLSKKLSSSSTLSSPPEELPWASPFSVGDSRPRLRDLDEDEDDEDEDDDEEDEDDGSPL